MISIEHYQNSQRKMLFAMCNIEWGTGVEEHVKIFRECAKECALTQIEAENVSTWNDVWKVICEAIVVVVRDA